MSALGRWPRTLRGRLAGILAALLVLGLGLTAVVTVSLVRHLLQERLDEQLDSAGVRFALALEHGGDGDSDDAGGDGSGGSGGRSATGAQRDGFRSVEGQSAGTLGARVVNGSVTAAAVISDAEHHNSLSGAALATLAGFTQPTGPLTVTVPDLGEYRILVSAGRDGDLLITGLPVAALDRTVSGVIVVVTAVFAGSLLVISVVAAFVVGRMTRPLTQFAETATAISALSLDEGTVDLPHRVPTTGADDEVNTLGAAFNQMVQRIESALATRADSEQRLRRFLADASHELRTPVAVILSHAELAHRQGGAALSEQVSRSIDRIADHAGRMGHLVDDLLLLARLDAGRPLARERVDLTRLVLDAVDDARIAAGDHHFRLELPDQAVTTTGDPSALAQVVTNLLANVVDHTPPGTTATVALTQDEQATRLTVGDDGPGMPAGFAERATDRFARATTVRSPGRTSTGLGLAIVSAIAQSHHGSVRVDVADVARSNGRTPSGVRIIVTLPIDDPGLPPSTRQG